MGLPQWLIGKESACSSGDGELIPRLGRSPGEGTESPLQTSCLENPMDREAWQAAVHGAEKSQTQLSTHIQNITIPTRNHGGNYEWGILHSFPLTESSDSFCVWFSTSQFGLTFRALGNVAGSYWIGLPGVRITWGHFYTHQCLNPGDWEWFDLDWSPGHMGLLKVP